MISIENKGVKYLVKISGPGTGMRPKTFTCNDIQEAHIAIDHYFIQGTKPHFKETTTNCPICRTIKGE